MHQSFTGSARRPRQVNLSGRPASNPWGVPGSTTHSIHGSTSNAAVAHAQADRAKRQHDREKVIASRKVQKTWRGHATRRRVKSQWREDWDRTERARLSLPNLDYAEVLSNPALVRPYSSQVEFLRQLHLLVAFQEFRKQIVRDKEDTTRLVYFAATLQSSEFDVKEASCRRKLERLGVAAAKHVKSLRTSPETPSTNVLVVRLSELISFLARFIPLEMARSAELYMEVLSDLVHVQEAEKSQEAGAAAVISILSCSSADGIAPYHAFVKHLFGDDTLSRNLRMLTHFAQSMDHHLLLQALADVPGHSAAESQLWSLAYLIWIERSASKSSDVTTRFEFVQVLSILLGLSANEISDRQGILDVPMHSTGSQGPRPIEPFILENLNVISEESAVREAISLVSQETTHNGDTPHGHSLAAKRLADYAVSLLRAFSSNGDKARNIRKCLWQTRITASNGAQMSTLQYIWEAMASSKVFARISSSHRNVLSALREASPASNQFGKLPPSNEEIDAWRTEWRIILLLLELYSFVLQLIQDDEFFVSSSDVAEQSSLSNASRKGLALEESALLTTFLKNLAFVLYWNAAELVPTTEVEELDNFASLFGGGGEQIVTAKSTKKSHHYTLAGNGVSHAYLKGLTTSLLRMLHERDSRRNFVPPGHWLMTSQVDMGGFIPAVVDEEEKRHQMGDDDDFEEELLDAEYENPSAQSPRSMFAQMMSGSGGINYHAASARHGISEQQKQQARRKRMIESLAPRLEILRNLPFFIPFETRVQIFREFVYNDQLRRRGGHTDPDIWRMSVARTTMGRDLNGRPPGMDVISRQHAEIRRESVFEDAYDNYYPLGDRLKEPIQISFIDQFGAPEAGIDGGGVTKEFLTSVTSEALDPHGPMPRFSENEQRFLFPNPLLWQQWQENLKGMGIREGSEAWNLYLREELRHFEFLGRVIGKCLYEGILIDINFAGFFLLKWALTGGSTVATNESGYRASINDLREFDEELYQGLLKLKNYPGDVEADFALNFTVNDTFQIQDDDGNAKTITKTVDLLPDGANKAVDNIWRHVYIERIVRYRLQVQPEKITNAFLRGLGQIISPSWLAMFNQKEIQKLIGGDNTELDIADLRRNTMYGGLYVIGDDGLEHPTVELFWKAMQEMDDDDRRKVLKFVTSTPRAPLLGFSNLNPKFSIRDSSSDQARLPSTSTCVNLLKLPRYGDLQTMKDKLLYAARSGAGFDLS
jgi:ubiquitin-protein ligase E3 C